MSGASKHATQWARATTVASLLSPDSLALLRILGEHGRMTAKALRARDPAPIAGKRSTQTRANELRAERMVRMFKPTPRDAMVVEITATGRAALLRAGADARAPAPAPAPTPAPAPVVNLDHVRAIRATRQETKRHYALYDGAELTCAPPRGIESLRAFTLPSLVNGERVPRTRPPIIMGSSKPDRLTDGRGQG